MRHHTRGTRRFHHPQTPWYRPLAVDPVSTPWPGTPRPASCVCTGFSQVRGERRPWVWLLSVAPLLSALGTGTAMTCVVSGRCLLAEGHWTVERPAADLSSHLLGDIWFLPRSGLLRVQLPLVLAHRCSGPFLSWGAHVGAGRRLSQRVCASVLAKPQRPPRPHRLHPCQACALSSCATRASRSGGAIPREGGLALPAGPTARLCQLQAENQASGTRGLPRSRLGLWAPQRCAQCGSSRRQPLRPSFRWSQEAGAPLRQDCFPTASGWGRDAACPSREGRYFPGVGDPVPTGRGPRPGSPVAPGPGRAPQAPLLAAALLCAGRAPLRAVLSPRRCSVTRCLCSCVSPSPR